MGKAWIIVVFLAWTGALRAQNPIQEALFSTRLASPLGSNLVIADKNACCLLTLPVNVPFGP